MRILALVTDAFGGYGGIAQYNRDLFSALSLSDAVQEIVVLPRLCEDPSLRNLPPKVRQLPPVANKFSYAFVAYEKTLREGPFDLLFCGHIHMAHMCALLARARKLPLWLQTHGIEAWEAPSRAIRFATERASLITTVSRFSRRRMLQWTNIDPTRVRVLPNAVRPFFSPGPASEPALAKYNLAGRKIILTVSRLSRADSYKGHNKVIEVLPELLKLHPDACYVIVGDGDGRGDLENLVSEFDLKFLCPFSRTYQ